jgi:predicted ATPase
MMLHYVLILVSEAHYLSGQISEAFPMLDNALATVKQSGECWFEAELHRQQGELTLQKLQDSHSEFQVANPQPRKHDLQADAEACFEKAIEIARWQKAKMLELLATTNLARLRHGQGKKVEAREMLDQVYNRFTEGFDTKDLQEAKALIEDLSQ